MRYLVSLGLLFGFIGTAISFSGLAKAAPDSLLRVVIIRHGEKSEVGDNLSCQGENRALQLPAVLYRKFTKPDYVYVPSPGIGKSMSHIRMFATIIPFAIKYDLSVNSEFQFDAYSAVAEHVLRKTGTVLMVWQHQAIPLLAAQLGVRNPPKWKDKDFDSIWTITFVGKKASLYIDREGIVPPVECSF